MCEISDSKTLFRKELNQKVALKADKVRVVGGPFSFFECEW